MGIIEEMREDADTDPCIVGWSSKLEEMPIQPITFSILTDAGPTTDRYMGMFCLCCDGKGDHVTISTRHYQHTDDMDYYVCTTCHGYGMFSLVYGEPHRQVTGKYDHVIPEWNDR